MAALSLTLPHVRYGQLLRFLLGSATALGSAASAAGVSSRELQSCASSGAAGEDTQGW